VDTSINHTLHPAALQCLHTSMNHGLQACLLPSHRLAEGLLAAAEEEQQQQRHKDAAAASAQDHKSHLAGSRSKAVGEAEMSLDC
jgi:hypothetical protein